jgi:hypothetical protein
MQSYSNIAEGGAEIVDFKVDFDEIGIRGDSGSSNGPMLLGVDRHVVPNAY